MTQIQILQFICIHSWCVSLNIISFIIIYNIDSVKIKHLCFQTQLLIINNEYPMRILSGIPALSIFRHFPPKIGVRDMSYITTVVPGRYSHVFIFLWTPQWSEDQNKFSIAKRRKIVSQKDRHLIRFLNLFLHSAANNQEKNNKNIY